VCDLSDKTIKEIADNLNITKDKARYRVSKLPRDFTYQKDGITYVKNKGFKAIEKDLGVLLNVGEKEVSHSNNVVDSMMSLLKKEIEEKNEQLSKKDYQLEKMQKLLDQQQQLTLQANSQIQQLQEQLALTHEQSDVKEKESNEEVKDEAPKVENEDKKWWHFLRK